MTHIHPLSKRDEYVLDVPDIFLFNDNRPVEELVLCWQLRLGKVHLFQKVLCTDSFGTGPRNVSGGDKDLSEVDPWQFRS